MDAPQHTTEAFSIVNPFIIGAVEKRVSARGKSSISRQFIIKIMEKKAKPPRQFWGNKSNRVRTIDAISLVLVLIIEYYAFA